jgi:DNA-directed RNA polymerase specialized sigma24 family protein
MTENDWPIEGLEVTAPLDTELYLQLEPMVNDVAGSEWKSSPLFSIDDVAQAIWEHMMANWSHYAGKDEILIRHMARRAARNYCLDQRNQYMYSTGAFLYTPGMVRRYLEEVVWCLPGDSMDIEARCDISEAYQSLPKGQKAAVYKRYAMGETLVRNAEQVAESRAVARMANHLNTGLRMRPVIDP